MASQWQEMGPWVAGCEMGGCNSGMHFLKFGMIRDVGVGSTARSQHPDAVVWRLMQVCKC